MILCVEEDGGWWWTRREEDGGELWGTYIRHCTLNKRDCTFLWLVNNRDR